MNSSIESNRSRPRKHCDKARRILRENGISFTEIRGDTTPRFRSKVAELTGNWSVPQITIAGGPSVPRVNSPDSIAAARSSRSFIPVRKASQITSRPSQGRRLGPSGSRCRSVARGASVSWGGAHKRRTRGPQGSTHEVRPRPEG